MAPVKAEVRERPSGKEWVVSFRNDQEPVRAKRTLYVFLTEAGEYKAANYTGARAESVLQRLSDIANPVLGRPLLAGQRSSLAAERSAESIEAEHLRS